VEDANSPTKCPKTTKLVLEMDPETKEPIIEVHSDLICLLKPHQVEGMALSASQLIEMLSPNGRCCPIMM